MGLPHHPRHCCPLRTSRVNITYLLPLLPAALTATASSQVRQSWLWGCHQQPHPISALHLLRLHGCLLWPQRFEPEALYPLLPEQVSWMVGTQRCSWHSKMSVEAQSPSATWKKQTMRIGLMALHPWSVPSTWRWPSMTAALTCTSWLLAKVMPIFAASYSATVCSLSSGSSRRCLSFCPTCARWRLGKMMLLSIFSVSSTWMTEAQRIELWLSLGHQT